MGALKSHTAEDFNPRSREGSDKFALLFNRLTLYFNPRSREGSDYRFTYHVKNAHLFQSALPRGERLSVHVSCQKCSSISIRAPARGATIGSRIMSKMLIYFNPRSREGSDIGMDLRNVLHEEFQSALPRGERQILAKWEKSLI